MLVIILLKKDAIPKEESCLTMTIHSLYIYDRRVLYYRLGSPLTAFQALHMRVLPGLAPHPAAKARCGGRHPSRRVASGFAVTASRE
jgi:hypothetical protein